VNASGIAGPYYDRENDVEGFFINTHAAMGSNRAAFELLFDPFSLNGRE
jgi:hypothetical protein